MQNPNTKKLDPTLGELIAAAGEVAFEHSNSDQEAYRLARIALIEILKRAANPREFDEEFDGSKRPRYFH
ncbi:MAG TPA: hypothetical protein VFU31_19885 [Candidatus Binatia bacterium]|nr:hypothetical protein [Candidatus Binatia bacterium]